MRAGETAAVVGPSGTKRSTLADVLLGLASPDRGTVRIDREPLETGRMLA